MSILSVNEIAEGRQSYGDEGERGYTRVFQVVTDSAFDGSYYVRTAAGIPQRGAVYVTDTESDLGARAKRVTASQDGDNPKLWRVTVEYVSSAVPEEANPLDRPAEVSWSFAIYQRPATQDIYGRPIVNSAGVEFDPPTMMDDSRPVLTVTRNEAAFDAALAIAYQDAVNSDSFLGFAPGTAKVMNISSRSQTDGEYSYWQTTYEFCFQREGWTKQLFDQGRQRKRLETDPEPSEGEPNLVEITIGGQPVSDPVPLDGNGQPVETPTPDTAVFLPYDVYKKLPFSVFNF